MKVAVAHLFCPICEMPPNHEILSMLSSSEVLRKGQEGWMTGHIRLRIRQVYQFYTLKASLILLDTYEN